MLVIAKKIWQPSDWGVSTLLLLMCALTSACDKSSSIVAPSSEPLAASPKVVPDIDGFKDAQFGATASELESLGYYCSTEKLDFIDEELLSCKKNSTLFGLPAIVEASLEDGVTITVAVTVVDDKPIDLVSRYTQSFGHPRQYATRSPYDLSTTVTTVWVSPAGGAIFIFQREDLSNLENPNVRRLTNDGSYGFKDRGFVRYEQEVIYYNPTFAANALEKLELAGVSAEGDF